MIGLGQVKRAIVSRKPHAVQALLVVLGLALATSARWFTDQGAYGVPFATFLPVVVLAAIFLDWHYAAITAVLSAMIVRRLLGFALPEVIWSAAALVAAYFFTALFMILVGNVLRRTVMEMDRQAAQFQAFNAELQHRAKNALQIVSAIASRASKAPDPIVFYETLASRMDLMMKANELLGIGTVRQCDLEELARRATEPFSHDAISFEGPAAQVPDEAGMPLMMALHELGTNALKYGALSVETGSVTVAWSHRGDEIDIVWTERGGPEVTPPTRRGLGSKLLVPQRGLKSVDLDFAPGGVVCRMTVPRVS